MTWIGAWLRASRSIIARVACIERRVADQHRQPGVAPRASSPARAAASGCGSFSAERTSARSWFERHRLGEIVERARLERGDRVLGAAVRGDDGDRQVGMVLGDVVHHRRARRRRAAACR